MVYRRNISSLTDDERHRLAGLVRDYLTQPVPPGEQNPVEKHRRVDHMHRFFTHHRAYIFGLETFVKSRLGTDPLAAKLVPLPYWDSRRRLPSHFDTFDGGPAVAPNTATPLAAADLGQLPSGPRPPEAWAPPWEWPSYLEQLRLWGEQLVAWTAHARETILKNPPVTDTTYLNTAYAGKPFPPTSGLDDPTRFESPDDLCRAHETGRGLGMDITEGLLHTASHYHGITHAALAGVDVPIDVDRIVQYVMPGGTQPNPPVLIGPFLNGANTAAPFAFWPLHAFFDTFYYRWERAWLRPAVTPHTVRRADGELEVFLVGRSGVVWHTCQAGDDGPNTDDGAYGNWEHWHRIPDDWILPPQRVERIATTQAPGGGIDVFGIGTQDGAPVVHARMVPPECNAPSRWDDLGGGNEAVSAVTAPSGSVYVVAIQSDGGVVRFRRRKAGEEAWTPWEEVVGGGQEQVTTTVDGTTATARVHVFALGDGLVRWRRETTAGGDWNAEGAQLVPADHLDTNAALRFTKIAVERNADRRLEVFAIGRDRKLYHSVQRTSRTRSRFVATVRFTSWEVLDDGPCQDLAVGRNKDGRLEVFSASGTKLYHRWQTAPNGSWTGGPESIPLSRAMGKLRDLFTGLDEFDRLMVFGVARDGLVWHAWQPRANEGPWIGWLPL